MRLVNKNTKTEICSQLRTAESFIDKVRGLIGTKKLEDQGVFFPNERWPHTFFMSIPIDIVYVNKNMKVVKINHSLPPWRMVMPVFSAWALIELPAGLAREKQLTVGDELYVGH